MKTRILTVAFGCSLLAAHAISTRADEARFFRITGPVPATITAVAPDGTVTWTNMPINRTFTVQTATSLSGESNWADWVQVPVSNAVTVHRVFDPHSPAGMAFIPAGSFKMGNCMGSSDGGAEELPLHTVNISAFYMDQVEVPIELWGAVFLWATNYGYAFTNNGTAKAANHPVVRVNWYDCVKWCNARSQREGLTLCYYTDAGLTSVYKTGQVAPYVNWSANGYRLPTEAEWEKAARGGTPGHRFPWSDVDTIQHSRANYYSTTNYSYDTSPTRDFHPTFATGGTPYTSPVGYFAANGYGLYDMTGDVSERCWDWYSSSYYGSSPTNDPKGPASGSYRVFRGGSWDPHGIDFCRTAGRGWNHPTLIYFEMGFRCVRAAAQ